MLESMSCRSRSRSTEKNPIFRDAGRILEACISDYLLRNYSSSDKLGAVRELKLMLNDEDLRDSSRQRSMKKVDITFLSNADRYGGVSVDLVEVKSVMSHEEAVEQIQTYAQHIARVPSSVSLSQVSLRAPSCVVLRICARADGCWRRQCIEKRHSSNRFIFYDHHFLRQRGC